MPRTYNKKVVGIRCDQDAIDDLHAISSILHITLTEAAERAFRAYALHISAPPGTDLHQVLTATDTIETWLLQVRSLAATATAAETK